MKRGLKRLDPIPEGSYAIFGEITAPMKRGLKRLCVVRSLPREEGIEVQFTL